MGGSGCKPEPAKIIREKQLKNMGRQEKPEMTRKANPAMQDPCRDIIGTIQDKPE